MIIVNNKNEAKSLLIAGEQIFKYEIKLNLLRKIQLLMTGSLFKGVELYNIGPTEMRGLGFMLSYSDLINYAVNNGYRVFVFKDGRFFSNNGWYLKFQKNR